MRRHLGRNKVGVYLLSWSSRRWPTLAPVRSNQVSLTAISKRVSWCHTKRFSRTRRRATTPAAGSAATAAGCFTRRLQAQTQPQFPQLGPTGAMDQTEAKLIIPVGRRSAACLGFLRNRTAPQLWGGGGGGTSASGETLVNSGAPISVHKQESDRMTVEESFQRRPQPRMLTINQEQQQRVSAINTRRFSDHGREQRKKNS